MRLLLTAVLSLAILFGSLGSRPAMAEESQASGVSGWLAGAFASTVGALVGIGTVAGTGCAAGVCTLALGAAGGTGIVSLLIRGVAWATGITLAPWMAWALLGTAAVSLGWAGWKYYMMRNQDQYGTCELPPEMLDVPYDAVQAFEELQTQATGVQH